MKCDCIFPPESSDAFFSIVLLSSPMSLNCHFLPPPPRLPLRRHPSASTLANSRTITRGRDVIHHRRGVFPITMSTPDDHPVKQHIELQNESDFDKLVSPDGLISICGFGSLLSGRDRPSFVCLIDMKCLARGFA